mmetsp:Transcript_15726/g.27130  ORF Transcript_15726/g.27130 Transcript_15726/m.27130 type:complete len:482 (+) Transcript_15726:532-1977(+)
MLISLFLDLACWSVFSSHRSGREWGHIDCTSAILASKILAMSFLLTLPMALRGMVSSTSSCCGTLYTASRCFAHSRKSLSASGAEGSRSTTMAATRSPHDGSGRPMTAISAMLVCSRHIRSISSADTFSPPVLMMSALARPNSRYTPSSHTATSPVLNQPSLSKVFFVSSGLLKYSLNTLGPLTRSSPTSPSAASRSPPSPSSHTMRSCTPGRGNPTAPGMRLPSYRFDIAIPISDMPYRSSSVCLLMFLHRTIIGSGRAAEPHTMSRSFATASVAAVRSSGFSFSYALISLSYIVGTPMKRVKGSVGRMKRRHMSSPLNLGRNSTTAPAQRAHVSALIMPWMWCRGSGWRMRSEFVHFHAPTRAATCARMLPWVDTTPLGRPVVPLVYRIMAPRLSVSSTEGGAGACNPSWAPSDEPGFLGSKTRNSMLFLLASGSRTGANRGWHSTRETLLSCSTYSSSGAGCVSHSGTAMAPLRHAAH